MDNIQKDNFFELQQEIDKDYYGSKSDFYYYYESICNDTQTKELFHQFLLSGKKTLVLDYGFIHRFHYENDVSCEKIFKSSLILAKNWKSLKVYKDSITATELKNALNEPFHELKKNKEIFRKLHLEIEQILEKALENLEYTCEHEETTYYFEKPIVLRAHLSGMKYRETRKFLMVGIIVPKIELK